MVFYNCAKDSARSKFAEMSQANGESVAQYHFRLRSQAAKCKFPEINDAIRSKLLQTMIDGRLRREAMVKSYSFEELLKHAANKKDIDQSLHASQVRSEYVNRVFVKCPVISVLTLKDLEKITNK